MGSIAAAGRTWHGGQCARHGVFPSIAKKLLVRWTHRSGTDHVKCSRKRWCASGCLYNANIEAEGHGGLDALVLVLSRQRSPTSLSRGNMADGDLVRSPPRPAMS